MADYFFDANALVKIYADEKGSPWTRTLFNGSENTIWIAEISLVEVSAAFARKRRERKISEKERARALSLFLQDSAANYKILAVDRSIVNLAVHLASRHPLRAYDLVQLARALQANAEFESRDLPLLTFVTADADLLRVAESIGFVTENPETHLDPKTEVK